MRRKTPWYVRVSSCMPVNECVLFQTDDDLHGLTEPGAMDGSRALTSRTRSTTKSSHDEEDRDETRRAAVSAQQFFTESCERGDRAWTRGGGM